MPALANTVSLCG